MCTCRLLLYIRESLVKSPASRVAEAPAQLRLLQQAPNHGCQRRGGLGRDEEARFTVDDDFFAADHAGRDNRQAGVHRFQQDERHSLVTRRQHEDVRRVEEEPGIAPVAGEMHAMTDAQLGGLGL